MRIPLLLVPALSGLTLGTALQAASVSAVPEGRLLASNCFQCHGTNGAGPGFDRLAGRPARKLFDEMKELQSGKEGNGIMAKHAWGYTDDQLRALSNWLSQQPATALRSAP